MTKIGQFGNDGGPLIVLPREAAPFWEGTSPPSDGRVVETDYRWDDQEIACDYDLACAVEAWMELTAVGSSWGLILPEEADAIAWLPLDTANPPEAFAVIRTSWDNKNPAEIRALYAAQPEESWTLLSASLTISSEEMLLHHAADSAAFCEELPWDSTALIGSALVLRIAPGIYEAHTCEVSLPAEVPGTYAIFTRFRRISILSES